MSRFKEIDFENELESGIYDRLCDNLNRPGWKRTEGGQCPEADLHFFEHVVPDPILAQLTDQSGIFHPPWGSVKTKGDSQEHFGINPVTGKFVPVGLRFSRNHLEWDDHNRGAGSRKLRLLTGNIWRPQIIVTIRPEPIYNFFFGPNPKYRTKIGKSTKLDRRKILADPKATQRWESCRLVPLRLVLLTVPTHELQYIKNADCPAPKEESIRSGLFTSEESRFYNDMDENHEMDEDEIRRQEFERIGREAILSYRLRKKTRR